MSPITPHPVATWVQLQVSPLRHERLRRRRRAARIVAARRTAPGGATPDRLHGAPPPLPARAGVPQQRSGETLVFPASRARV